jgi:hypothetical protein
MRIVARWAVVALAVVVWTQARPAEAVAAQPPTRPVGVDWGPGHFTGQHALQAWLRQRGVRYEVWLRRHPGARYLMTHSVPPKPAQARNAVPAKTTSARAAAHTTAVTGPADLSAGEESAGVISAMYGAALILLLLAALPYGVLAGVIPRVRREQALSVRVGSASVAIAIAVGATVALLG